MARPFDTYSKRNSIRSNELVYDLISRKLKNQIYHIWELFFRGSNIHKNISQDAWKEIFDMICSEEGVKNLYYSEHFAKLEPQTQVDKYFEELEDTNKILDVVEIIFFIMEVAEDLHLKSYGYYREITYDFKSCIEDLNERFLENNVGYQYLGNKIVKASNHLLHEEVTKRAISFLKEDGFENANEEFIRAQEHFRHDRFIECLNESLKAFESVLKILIKRNGWSYREEDTAKSLIAISLNKRLIPSYLQNSFSGIRTILESSVPTIRNKNSAHGQGPDKVVVPKYLANYMLYLTGSTIIFLVEASSEKKME
jgi:hypothetical protein